MPQNFTPPPVDRADTVIWYPDAKRGEDHGFPAVINYQAGNTVGLTAYRGGQRPMFVDYCRHVDDPWLNEGDADRKDAGAWEYSPMLKRLLAVESALQDLTSSKRSSTK